MTDEGSINDVEKRWHDPQMARAAITYVVIVVALAGAAFAATAVWRSLLAAVLVPAILFAGGIGAFVRTYRVWRAEGVWPIWQAAGWFLLLAFLFCLGIPFSVASADRDVSFPADRRGDVGFTVGGGNPAPAPTAILIG